MRLPNCGIELKRTATRLMEQFTATFAQHLGERRVESVTQPEPFGGGSGAGFASRHGDGMEGRG